MTTKAPVAPPTEVTFHDQKFTSVREGLAEILGPPQEDPGKNSAERQRVFYNPLQQFNRDISVLAIRAFAHDFAFVKVGQKQRQKQKRQKTAKAPQGTKRKREVTAENVARDDTVALVKNDEAAEDKHGQRGQPTAPTEQGQPSDTAEEVRAESAGVASEESKDRDLGPQVEQDRSHDDPEARPFGFDGTFKILDALSATGLRALRYAKEIPMATQITANDVSATATAAIKVNAEYNSAASKIQVSTADANDHMYHANHGACKSSHNTASGQYHVIDLDPYGTAAPFIDSAVRALVDGGLLCVTCTDAGVFASSGYLEKTYSLYGGIPFDGPPAHEGGLRLIIHSIATAAARYGIAIEPLLSLSIDFYARIFIRIRRSPAEVKFLASKTMFVHNCDKGCGAWTIQHLAHTKEKTNAKGDTIYHFKAAQGPSASPECSHCGFKTHLAGPMWGGPLHNQYFVQQILSSLPTLDPKTYPTRDRIEGMLKIALNECVDFPPALPKPPSDSSVSSTAVAEAPQVRPIPPLQPHLRTLHPFFIHPSSLARVLHTTTPSEAHLRGALLGLGYKASRSHTKAGSITTDAPWVTIWHVMREWVRQKAPVKPGAIKPAMAGFGIMNRVPSTIPEAGEVEQRSPQSESTRTSRAQETKLGTEISCITLAKLAHEVDMRKLDEMIGVLQTEAEDKRAMAEFNARNQTPDSTTANGADSDRKINSTPPASSAPQVVFNEQLGKRGQEKEKGVVFYAQHPPNWGPGRRAGA